MGDRLSTGCAAQPVDQGTDLDILNALKGRRVVATGGAQRNPWNQAAFSQTYFDVRNALKGRRIVATGGALRVTRGTRTPTHDPP